MEETKFEDALTRLEKIVEELEAGNLSLEDSLQRFEEGVKLARICDKKLKEAQKKIQILTKAENGTFDAEPFSDKEQGREPGAAEENDVPF